MEEVPAAGVAVISSKISMPSRSLTYWQTTRSQALDEIEHAHRSVGGTGPGRRYATQQINYAYAMLLSSQFQGFCRDLHSESIDQIIPGISPASMRIPLQREFALHRKLDTGNPNPGNIGADFNRLGLPFWSFVEANDARNSARQALLEELNRWRNAIAHHDFSPAILGSAVLRLAEVRNWRSACAGLAISFDEVMRQYIQSTIGISPW